MSKKSPFVGYSEDEVLSIEAVTYVIVVGSNFYIKDGNFVFTKKSAAYHYNKILRELVGQLVNGDDDEKKNARRVLNNFRIEPLRLH